LSFFLPLLWVFKPIFRFADYPLHPVPFGLGVLCFVVGLWIFYLSHRHLGEFWSITLEVREKHRLITEGIYRRIRIPCTWRSSCTRWDRRWPLPNWVVGPSYLAGFGLLFALRIRAEERMMREEFPAEYEAYAARTKRLIPGIWVM
jgi:protein-S-isoprenylcysteine O-methyltransferase Ste14